MDNYALEVLSLKELSDLLGPDLFQEYSDKVYQAGVSKLVALGPESLTSIPFDWGNNHKWVEINDYWVDHLLRNSLHRHKVGNIRIPQGNW